MNDLDQINLILEKGLVASNGINIYLKNDIFYVLTSDVQCFTVSIRRMINTFYPNSEYVIKKYICDYYNTVKIEENTLNNNCYLKIIIKTKLFQNVEYNIKLKELDEYIDIYPNDSFENVIIKQKKKINLLLKKIDKYKTKYPNILSETLTDDEFL